MAKDVFARIEMKFVMNEMQYRTLRKRLQVIAHEDEYGLTKVCNIYYDTPSFELIRTSLMKPAYKEKLRLRTYGEPSDDSLSFVEVKKKFQGVVYKRRMGLPYEAALEYLNDGADVTDKIDNPLELQIKRETDYFMAHYAPLTPSMVITYDRVALIGNDDPELRITFDKNIRWRRDRLDLRKGTDGSEILQPGEYLMELKIAGGIPMPIVRALSELQIRQVSFSKYGRAYEQMMKGKEVRKCSIPSSEQYWKTAV